MTYNELIYEVLKKAHFPLGVKEIWDNACKMGLDKQLLSIGKSPKNPIDTIGTIIYLNIRNNQNSKFIFASKRPTTFWLKERENELKLPQTQKALSDVKEEKAKFHERDLHPLLVKFLNDSNNFKLRCKTIYHERSKKRQSGKDKWSYPDIVGVYFPYGDYEKQTVDFLKHINQSNYKLFSFELKISLNFSNLKESYFQAVSNSSWANEGYLVVFDELDDEVLSELRRLNQSFGIGVIKLESEILDSKILLSAKEKELDIQTLNFLVEQNVDFETFIDDINKRISAGIDTEIKARFDEIFDDEKLQKYLKEKHI